MSEKWMTYIGYGLLALSILFLLMDGGMKVVGAQASIETTRQLGFAASTTRLIGLILLICTVLYAIPQTRFLGAILVTAYLGGAIAIQLQHQAPLFSHTLFGVYLGLMVWGGVWLTSAQARQILPFVG